MPRNIETLEHKSVPPGARLALEERLNKHAEKHWAGSYLELKISYRGPFAYVGALRSVESFQPRRGGTKTVEIVTKLCRLKFFGQSKRWLFAFYKYSDEIYEPSFVPGTSSFWGTPEQCFDCAATVYLQDF